MPNNPERRKFLQWAGALTGAAVLGGPLAVRLLLEKPPPVQASKKPKEPEPPQPPATAPATPAKKESGLKKESDANTLISPLNVPWKILPTKHTYVPLARDITPVDLNPKIKYIIYAPFTGIIELHPRQNIAYNGVAGWGIGGYGNMVILRSETWWLRMGHFADNPSVWVFAFNNITNGKTIRIGTPIGYLGETGLSSIGPHIHLELQKGGKFVVPTAFIPNYEQATVGSYLKP